MNTKKRNTFLHSTRVCFSSGLARVSSIIHAGGSILILLIMLLMCADVIGRWIFARPIPLVSELVGLTIVVAVYFQLAHAVRENRLTQVDLLTDPITRRWPTVGRCLDVLHNLAGIAICFCIAWVTLPRLRDAFEGQEFIGLVGVLTLPIWPVSVVVIGGSVLAALAYLGRALQLSNFRGDGE